MTAHGLAKVRVLGLPLDVYARVQEVHEGLMREFALIALSQPGRSVPARLVALTKDLQARYANFTREASERQAMAAERGERAVDLVYEVPVDVAQAAARYDTLLDEAVEYCRQGDLLTLAPSEEHIAFRRWFLGEFVRQIRGEQPVSWQEYVDAGGRSPLPSRDR